MQSEKKKDFKSIASTCLVVIGVFVQFKWFADFNQFHENLLFFN